MWPLAVAAIGSSLISANASRKAARAQSAGIDAQARHGIEAAKLNIAAQKEANAQNYAMQKEFAQHGIQWKAADARLAGLHPLAALGAQTTAASPSYAAGDPGAAERVRGDAAAARGAINAQARISQAQQMSTMMVNLAQAKYYDSLAKKNMVRVDPKQEYPIVGSIDTEKLHPGVPMNEAVGTQRTYNLNMDSDVQNWEDKYGDIPGAFVGASKMSKDYGRQLGLPGYNQFNARGYRVRNGWIYKRTSRGFKKWRKANY